MVQKFAVLTIALLLMIGIADGAGLRSSVAADDTASSSATTVAFDAAEDMSRFVFDADVVHEDGLPAHGSTFITQGYLYPAGTLTASNGVLADGSPEFPDKVLGTWVCKGWFVGEGAHASSGPMVISTQQYTFGEELGNITFVTEGYELADPNVPILRAITGGTGPFAAADGQAEQQFLGFNASEGVNISIVAEIQGVDEEVSELAAQQLNLVIQPVASIENTREELLRED